jgi:hypothetical protein
MFLHVDLARPVVLDSSFPILDRTLVFIHSRILTLIRALTDIRGASR